VAGASRKSPIEASSEMRSPKTLPHNHHSYPTDVLKLRFGEVVGARAFLQEAHSELSHLFRSGDIQINFIIITNRLDYFLIFVCGSSVIIFFVYLIL